MDLPDQHGYQADQLGQEEDEDQAHEDAILD